MLQKVAVLHFKCIINQWLFPLAAQVSPAYFKRMQKSQEVKLEIY